MGNGDRDVHLLGAAKLTDMTAAHISLDIFSHPWTVEANTDCFPNCPFSAVAKSIMEFLEDFLPLISAQQHSLVMATGMSAI